MSCACLLQQSHEAQQQSFNNKHGCISFHKQMGKWKLRFDDSEAPKRFACTIINHTIDSSFQQLQVTEAMQELCPTPDNCREC